MLETIYRTITIAVFLSISITALGQNFYVNGYKHVNDYENITYEFIAGRCDIPKDSMDMRIFTCKAGQPHPTHVDSNYTDIAIDAYQNLWYITISGDLHTRKLDDTGSCTYVGSFADTPATFGALVADRDGAIYTAANFSHYCAIYKYDNSGFRRLGIMPKFVLCSGDLFFYQRRLFMTCVGSRVDSYSVYEVTLADPTQSCYYMPLTGMAVPWGAFSTNDGAEDHVYVTSTDTMTYSSTQLFEIDMKNKKVLFSICNYPFQIRGAAAYYDLSGDTTHCPFVPKSVGTNTRQDEQITVYNPSNQTIRIKTNIDQHDIRSIYLNDIYGRRVRQYATNDFPDKMAISDLPDGMYILYIATKDSMLWKEKVLKGRL